MSISTTTSEKNWEKIEPAYRRLMQHAQGAGFHGYDGDCAAAAIAINDVLLDGKASYVAGLNVFFFEHMRYSVGHVAVQVSQGGPILDGSGDFKEESDLTSWSMLDKDDTEWVNRAAENGLDMTEEEHDNAGFYVMDDEADLRDSLSFDYSRVHKLSNILRQTLERKNPEDRALLARLKDLAEPLPVDEEAIEKSA